MPAWTGSKEEYYEAKTKVVNARNLLEKEWELWLAEMYASDLSRNVQILIFDNVRSEAYLNQHLMWEQRYLEMHGMYTVYAAFARQVIDLQ